MEIELQDAIIVQEMLRPIYVRNLKKVHGNVYFDQATNGFQNILQQNELIF